MIAIISAVPLETDLLRCRLSPCAVQSCGHRDLFRGNLSGGEILLLHGGVGKANAAAAATSLLERFRPSLVLVAGCGGSYPESGLATGDLALANEEIYGDEGVITPAGFRDMEEIGFPLVQVRNNSYFNRFPVDSRLLDQAADSLRQTAAETGRTLNIGSFVTVSSCSGTDRSGREMALRTGGICENMEGAAVAQICLLYNVPFLEIRGISNLVEDRDLRHWDLVGAARIAQRAVMDFLAYRNDFQDRA